MTTLPNYAVSPGEHIQEWLEDHSLNAAELARRLDVTPKHVSELLSGKAPLSATIAIGLERVTGVPARLWNTFEVGYREDLARLAEEEVLASQYEQAKLFPLSYLRKWGFISVGARNKAGTVRELLSIFRIGSLYAFDSTWAHAKVAYRKVSLEGDKAYERATWLALGEREARVDDLPEFNRERLESLIPQLRTLTATSSPDTAMTEVESLLHSAGVGLALIPPIPCFGVHGATRWIAGHPIVQLSMRGKKDDQLWFTLFHELGHVLLHNHKTVFLQGTESLEEAEADRYASQTLIPEEYRDQLPMKRNIGVIRDLATELGIAPSIVLGQAQKLTGDYAWGHELKITLEWALKEKT